MKVAVVLRGLVLLCAGGCQPNAAIPLEPARAPSANARPDAAHESGSAAAAGADVDGGFAALSDSRRVLETFIAPPYEFELSILRQAPDPHGCIDPFRLRMLKSGQPVDEFALWESSCGQASTEPAETIRGADRESKAWTTDDEHCEIGVAARTVPLSGQTGLLVTQALGYEYRYSLHYLLLAESGRLRTIWSFAESIGAHDFSTTTALSTDESDRMDIAFVHIRRSETRLTTGVTAKRLRFDLATREIVESPLPDASTSLHVLVVGNFRSPKSANRRESSCLRRLELLRGSYFPSLHAPPFYFGRVYVRRSDAEAAAAELDECPELPKPQILELRFTPRRAAAKRR